MKLDKPKRAQPQFFIFSFSMETKKLAYDPMNLSTAMGTHSSLTQTLSFIL